MLGNQEYNADAYDATCRVPGCEWRLENASPTIVGAQLVPHINLHKSIGAPVFALQVSEGYEGLDEENPVRTHEDGWNRSPTLSTEEIEKKRAVRQD